MPEPEVFLSYRSGDRVVAERIAQALRGKGLRVFFDQWWLTPGRDWRAALEQAMARCSAFAVLLGPRGLGPWQQREVSLALLRVDRGEALPIVPIRLPVTVRRTTPRWTTDRGGQRQPGLRRSRSTCGPGTDRRGHADAR
ncbi:MAG: toll/interleukin-1 receptor domain-containing protein, partial [Planctomycetes bacterium]|nr:toll/interleukin-1 receptor domain-containing protein [Planctomycetota bacterium]